MVSPDVAPVLDLLRRGDGRGARQQGLDLLAVSPSADAYRSVGLACLACGDPGEGARHLASAHELQPTIATARELATAYAQLARWRDVVSTLDPVLDEADARTIALYLLAATANGSAVTALDRLVEHDLSDTTDPDLACEHGRALHAAGLPDEAEAALRRTLALATDHARAHDALAHLYQDTDRGDLALAHWQTAAALRPHSGRAWLDLSVALAYRGRNPESREARQRALAIGLPQPDDYSAALKLLLFDPEETARSLREAFERAFPDSQAGHAAWGDASSDASGAEPRAASVGGAGRVSRRSPRHRPTGRRLRIGYLSGEFHHTPAYFFLTPFLFNHSRDIVDVTLYNAGTIADHHTAAYRASGHRWQEVAFLSDAELLAVIDADAIDVLVDLSGHFPGNRLRLFARRAAPVQATFPNFPSTTGCVEMDHFFTDAWTSPEGSDPEYTERLHRLAGGYLVYAPPEPLPVSEAPLRRGRGLTIGLFQQHAKITPQVWDVVAAVLRQCPGSTLLMHNGDPELARDGSATSAFLRDQLRRRDVDPGRLRAVGALTLVDHLALISNADIALDTFPYTGQTTTCECLWMGVPVVTVRGTTHVGRVSAGLLARAGLDDLITSSLDQFVTTARHLAHDPDRIVHLRGSLRARLADTGLLDGVALARQMEEAYRAWVT